MIEVTVIRALNEGEPVATFATTERAEAHNLKDRIERANARLPGLEPMRWEIFTCKLDDPDEHTEFVRVIEEDPNL